MSQIKRVDPHLERIKRNRLHPRYAEVTAAAAPAIFMGPNGIVRKNPHQIGFIGPNGLKRIDRANLNQSGSQAASSAAVEEQKPLHQVENPTQFIVVVPDLPAGRLSSHDKDVLGLAHQLASKAEQPTAVLAISFGENKEEGWKEAGVDRHISLTEAPFNAYNPEAQVSILEALDKSLSVAHFLFADTVNGGGDLGRRLSASLGVRPVTHGWKIEGDEIICRAAAGSQDLKKPLSQVMLLDAEVADPVDETQHEASAFDAPSIEYSASSLQDLGLLAVDPSEIHLGEAPFILSGGNGIDDWNVFHNAAKVLGATEGASRVAVDDGFMPRHRQVGATGTWVSAQVYIAVGISGAVQHLQGIAQVDKVIAINTEAGCDMVKRANLSIIADSTETLSALVKLIEQERGQLSSQLSSQAEVANVA